MSPRCHMDKVGEAGSTSLATHSIASTIYSVLSVVRVSLHLCLVRDAPPCELSSGASQLWIARYRSVDQMAESPLTTSIRLNECIEDVAAAHYIAREPLTAAQLHEAVVPAVSGALKRPGEINDNEIRNLCFAVADLECGRRCCKGKRGQSVIDADARKWLGAYVMKREWRVRSPASQSYESVKRCVLKLMGARWVQQEGQQHSTAAADHGWSGSEHCIGMHT